jgi:hypothetical protein
MPAATKTPGKTIDLADLFAKRVREVEIQVTDDESIWVKYKPDALNKKLQAAIAAAESEDAAALLMVELLTDWSLTMGGEPYAITVENLEDLGLPLLVTIAAIVQEDFNTNVQMGKPTTTAVLAD